MNHMRAVSASRLAKASFLLAAIPLAALLFLLFTLWRWGRFVLFIVNYASQNLAERSGTSHYFLKGVVIVVTIPFFWAVAKYMHGLWFWLRGVGPGLRLYRSAHGIMIVGYVGAFFIAMYIASLHAYAFKKCADTPEGTRAFDGGDIDPVYGIPLKPCTFEQIVALREAEVSLERPKRIEIENVRDFEFFDSITKRPRVWYYRGPNSQIALYDRPGKYPGTGEDLRPIDPETREEIIRLRETSTAQRAKEEEKKAVSERQREKAAFIEKYVNTGMVKRVGQKEVAVLVFSKDEDDVLSVADTLGNTLTARGLTLVSPFFKQAFVREGRAQRLLAGDWKEATELEIASRVDYVVLGQESLTVTSSSQFENLISAEIRVQLRCLNMHSQTYCGSQVLDSIGAGFSKTTALDNASTKARPQLESFAQTLQLN